MMRNLQVCPGVNAVDTECWVEVDFWTDKYRNL